MTGVVISIALYCPHCGQSWEGGCGGVMWVALCCPVRAVVRWEGREGVGDE